MNHIQTHHEYRVDLSHGPLEITLPHPLCHQDALADRFTAIVRDGMTPVSLDGMQAVGYLTFGTTRHTLPLSGTAFGSAATLTLTGDCYAVPGPFTLVMQLIDGETRHSILRIRGVIQRSSSDEVISSGELLPPLAELLTQISDMQSATADANLAAERAEKASSNIAPAIVVRTAGDIISINDAVVRPVSALSSAVSNCSAVTLTRTGRNVFGGDALAQAIISKVSGATLDEDAATVTYTASKISGVTLFDRFLPDTQYTIILSVASATGKRLNLRVHYADGTSTLIDAPQTSPGLTMIVTEPGKTVTAIIGSNQGGTVTLNHDSCGVFEGVLTEADFQIYAGQTLTATLPDTIASGSLDWLSGQLTVTHASDGTLLDPPVIHQLAPHSLTPLPGCNTLWSSSGLTTLTYTADTKAYIDAKFAALAATLINA